MHLLVSFPSPWPAASRKSVAGFVLQFPFEVSLQKRPFQSISRTAGFGRLVAIPFRGLGTPERRFLSHVPFGFPYRCTLWSVLLNCVLFRRERSFCCLLTVSGGLGLLVLSSNPCSHQEAMIQPRRTQEATAFEVTENMGVASTCTIMIITNLAAHLHRKYKV